MKNSAIYSVIFTLGLCAACSAVLTFATEYWGDQIRANEQYALTYAIVDALGLCDQNSTREEVVQAFSQEIKLQDKKSEEDPDIYIGANQEVGAAIQWVAQGKYGPIKGVLALTPDKQRIKALRVYEQQETPGLGGEVANPTWLAKFVNVPVSIDGEMGIIISNKVEGPNVVDGISGASKTTFAVGTCLNEAIATLCSGGQKLEAVDFGIGPDAVTRATPGYPKEMKKPENFKEQKKRPPFMAPPGVTNIAFEKPVICSMEEDDFIEGFADQLTDGVKKSREGDFVDLGPDLQWAQVDLGGEFSVFCVVVWHYYRNPVIYRDVVIQVSNDPEFESGVTTLFNNDHDDSSGLGAGTDPSHMAAWWGEVGDARGPSNAGVRCRYVRVYTNGGCADEMNRFIEIAVYGK